MLTIIKRAACWWLGHADGLWVESPKCPRCGKITEYSDWVETPRWIRLRTMLVLPEKCPDCGGRWRCRAPDRCVPF